jgi:protein-S-isoprenylcysteine O-methyltransferase Ste14
MTFNWRRFRGDHPRLFVAAVMLKHARTKVALLLVALFLGKAVYTNEPPFDLDEINAWVVLGLILVITGTGIRFAALGSIRKHEDLATTGVYSLCRHPLYLGSILMAFGFCILLDDIENFFIVGAYFLTFYPLNIVWEEIRLSETFGEQHAAYCATTPILLPLGRRHGKPFRVRMAFRNGGIVLIASVLALLGVVEVMAETMRR